MLLIDQRTSLEMAEAANRWCQVKGRLFLDDFYWVIKEVMPLHHLARYCWDHTFKVKLEHIEEEYRNIF